MVWIPLFKETVFLCLRQENNDERDILNYFILLPGPNCSLFWERLGRVPTIFWQNSSAETTSYFPPSPFSPPPHEENCYLLPDGEFLTTPVWRGGGGGTETAFQRISSGPWRRREPVGLRHSRASFAREIQNWRVSEDSFPTPGRTFRPVQIKYIRCCDEKNIPLLNIAKMVFMQWWA